MQRPVTCKYVFYVLFQLCLLQTFTVLAANEPNITAEVMNRTIVVVGTKLCWSDALFFCRDHFFDLFSITSEKEQREVEKVLTNISFNLTEHVWFGLRRYLMGDKWFWMSGASKTYTNWETKYRWKESSRCCSIETSASFHWRDLPCEDHLYFICEKSIWEYDQRVEFFSSTKL